MKCIKKLVALTLAAVLALTMLTACGESGVQVDLQKSKEIADVINERRAAGEKSELVLSEEASLLLGNWAKAAAANKNNSSAAAAKEKAARDSALTEVKKLTIDGKSVSSIITSYTLYSTTANDVKGVLEKYPQWFVRSSEDAANYVAAAVYENGQNSACVVFVIEAN